MRAADARTADHAAGVSPGADLREILLDLTKVRVDVEFVVALRQFVGRVWNLALVEADIDATRECRGRKVVGVGVGKDANAAQAAKREIIGHS